MTNSELHYDADHRYNACSICLDEISYEGTYDINFPSINDVKWRIREVIQDHLDYFIQYDTLEIVRLPSNGMTLLYPLGDWELSYEPDLRREYDSQTPIMINTNSDEFKKAFFNTYEETFIYLTMEQDIRFKVNGNDAILDGFLPIQ